jgi:2-phospho-L-lactate/phosphoenolpyruvate guanylyltransferase
VNMWAIVPVKPFNRSKSRLASVLSPSQREALSRQMMEQTLKTLKLVEEISGILVVSRDQHALALARQQYGVQMVQESGNPELNEALTRATQMVVATLNARSVLIMASDIPMLTVDDLRNMIALSDAIGVVLAPDRHSDGTNAMIVRPPSLIPYRYGEGSLQKHIEETRKHGLEPKLFESPTMSLDIDVPADLDLYRQMLIERELSQPAWLQQSA